MAGMCRHTGKRLEGWPHIAQSLGVILTTRLRTRIERRGFGSVIPDRLDRAITPDLALDIYTGAAEAIAQFEPRVTVDTFQIVQSDEGGDMRLAINVTENATGNRFTTEVLL